MPTLDLHPYRSTGPTLHYTLNDETMHMHMSFILEVYACTFACACAFACGFTCAFAFAFTP